MSPLSFDRGTHFSCRLYAIFTLSATIKEFGSSLNISRKRTYPVRYGSVSTLSTHLSLLFFHESTRKFLCFQLHPFDTALDSDFSLRQLSLYCLSPCLRGFSYMAHVPYVQTDRTLKRLKVPQWNRNPSFEDRPPHQTTESTIRTADRHLVEVGRQALACGLVKDIPEISKVCLPLLYAQNAQRSCLFACTVHRTSSSNGTRWSFMGRESNVQRN